MRKTVLVLGAGASVDFGFPTGAGLSDQIERSLTFRVTPGNNLTGHQALWTQLQSSRDSVGFMPAARKVAQALPYSTSIDDVLYKFGDDQLAIKAGKAAIVAAILEAERNSWLMQTRHAQNLQDTASVLRSQPQVWPFHFLKFVQSNTPATMPTHAFDGLSIINFNYDRCLEHYLFHALQPAFAIDADSASAIVSGLKILHPYGTVGPLPWQDGSQAKVDFGTEPAGVRLLEIANNIRTFTEQQEDTELSHQARHLIGEAEQVVFLGFGFHGQNMTLIGPHNKGFTDQIYGTVMGTSDADQGVFAERISRAVFGQGPPQNYRPHFAAVTCADFVNQYGLRLFR